MNILTTRHWETYFWYGQGDSKTVKIVSVDREKVPYEKRRLIPPEMAKTVREREVVYFDDSIPLSPGEHKLLIELCESVDSFLGARRKCARTVLRLHAKKDGRYRLAGSVNDDKNHADVWIEDLNKGSLVVAKVRVKGLRTN